MNATVLNNIASQIVEKVPENVQEHLSKVTTMRAVQVGLGFVVLGRLYSWWESRIPVPKYGGIFSFSSLLSTIRMSKRGPVVLSEYYSQHPMAMMPAGSRWLLIVRGEFVDEVNRAPDSVLSFTSATEEVIQAPHTLGAQIVQNHYHHAVVRNYMTRQLQALFPEVYDEVKFTFENDPTLNADDWKELHVYPWILKVVAKASNRVFVGLPLCRDPGWLSVVIEDATSVVKTATFINLFPVLLRGLVGWLVSGKKSRLQRASKLAKDTIEVHLDRVGKEKEHPDFLDELMSVAPPEELNVMDMTRRIIAVNFAAIHTSSISLTHAIYWLTARPEYIEPMREEIEAVTKEMGWSKNAIGHMPKVESFMKECMRVVPLGANTMSRRVLKPFKFSNGVSPPVGTVIATHVYATHMDDSIYPNAKDFDGFRFVKQDDDTERRAKETMYSTSINYMQFSHGRHACPGRFFASMELKTMFAYLVLHYDFAWPAEVTRNLKAGERYRPKDMWFGGTFVPDPKVKILVRKRQT